MFGIDTRPCLSASADLRDMLHFVMHVLGVDTQSSYWYDAWSGCIPALLTSTTIIATALAVLHRHTCHVAKCFRPGKYEVAGGRYYVCKKHHPDDGPITAKVVQEAHANWRDD